MPRHRLPLPLVLAFSSAAALVRELDGQVCAVRLLVRDRGGRLAVHLVIVVASGKRAVFVLVDRRDSGAGRGVGVESITGGGLEDHLARLAALHGPEFGRLTELTGQENQTGEIEEGEQLWRGKRRMDQRRDRRDLRDTAVNL